MKYVVKCHYCGHSYIVDAKEEDEDFQCDTCGGQNGINDVVERIDEPVIVEKEVIKKVYVKESVRQKTVKKDYTEADIQTIKNFDTSKHEIDDSFFLDIDSPEKSSAVNIIWIMLIVVIWIVCFRAIFQ